MSNHTFTGVFIPAKIWLAKDLIPQEKMMLAEIKALSEESGWCFATNSHFAKWLGCGTQNISNYIKRFEREGMIEVTYTDKKTFAGRRLRVNIEWFHGLTTPYTGNVAPYTGNVAPYTGNVTEIQFKDTFKPNQQQQTQKTAADGEAIFLSSTTGAGGVTIVESFNLEEKKEKDTPNSAAPLEKEKVHTLPHRPGPSVVPRWDAFDIDKEAELMKSDYRVLDKYGKDLGLDPDSAKRLMPAAVDEFVEDQKAATYNYQNTRQIRTHFFNWILTAPKAKAAAKATLQQRFAPAPTPSNIPKNLQGLIGK